jgi:hypothetical protein
MHLFACGSKGRWRGNGGASGGAREGCALARGRENLTKWRKVFQSSSTVMFKSIQRTCVKTNCVLLGSGRQRKGNQKSQQKSGSLSFKQNAAKRSVFPMDALRDAPGARPPHQRQQKLCCVARSHKTRAESVRNICCLRSKAEV